MAARNETTIEGSSNAHYNVGMMHNLRSVFGRRVWTWWLPLYFSGPDGNGIYWPSTKDQPQARVASVHVGGSSSSGCGNRDVYQWTSSLPAENQNATEMHAVSASDGDVIP